MALPGAQCRYPALLGDALGTECRATLLQSFEALDEMVVAQRVSMPNISPAIH